MRYVSFVLMFALFAFYACEDNKNEEKFVIEFSPVEEHDFGTVEVNKSASTTTQHCDEETSSTALHMHIITQIHLPLGL